MEVLHIVLKKGCSLYSRGRGRFWEGLVSKGVGDE